MNKNFDFGELGEKKEEKKEYILSDQAVGALQMALIQCLKDQSDIVQIIKSWRLIESDQGLIVVNPNIVEFSKEDA